VAEHLNQNVADTFVDSLCRHSDVVLFSAAVPGQGGTHHVNEQWPSYWAARFSAREYECFDILRNRIWADERVDWWYRQNLLLFATGEAKAQLAKQWTPSPGTMLDIAHPRFRDQKRDPGVQHYAIEIKRDLRGFVQSLLRAIRRRLSRLKSG
jgi:hypothetical protein